LTVSLVVSHAYRVCAHRVAQRNGFVLSCSVRTWFKRLTLGMRFDRFLLDLRTLLALLDRIAAMIISSSDLVSIYSLNLLAVVPSKNNFACVRSNSGARGSNARLAPGNLAQNTGLRFSLSELAGA
jgi:hypothetical protein